MYHLEGKNELAGKKFVWLSACIYIFDKELNIVKVNQQGEFYPEEETFVTFEGHSSEKLKQQILHFYSLEDLKEMCLFNNEEVEFTFEMSFVGPSFSLFPGVIKGLSQYDKLSKIVEENFHDFEYLKPIDIFLGLDDPSCDAIIAIDCSKRLIRKEDYLYNGKSMSLYSIRKFF